MRFSGDRKRGRRYVKLESEKDKKEEEASASAGADSADADSAKGAGADAAGKNENAEKTGGGEKAGAQPDWKDLYARLLADFDNFKKRTARDREDTYRYAEADILGDMLPAVDNLALALATAKNPDDPFVKGVQLVYVSFLGALKDHGAEPFDSVGKPFDTETMEAIAQLPSDETEEGKVSNEVKRGWMLKGKVLRAAQVVVSSGSPATQGNGQAAGSVQDEVAAHDDGGEAREAAANG